MEQARNQRPLGAVIAHTSQLEFVELWGIGGAYRRHKRYDHVDLVLLDRLA